MILINTLIFFILSFSTQTATIEGTWITQDDETGRQKSEVLIYKENGKLYGKITKLLLPEDNPLFSYELFIIYYYVHV